MYKLGLDVLPDDTGHLVTVELDDGVLDLDFLDAGHGADESCCAKCLGSWCCCVRCGEDSGGEGSRTKSGATQSRCCRGMHDERDGASRLAEGFALLHSAHTAHTARERRSSAGAVCLACLRRTSVSL